MCYLVICGLISGFGVPKARKKPAQNLLSSALSLNVFHFLASVCLTDTCTHICMHTHSHSQAVEMQAKDDCGTTQGIDSRFSCADIHLSIQSI